MVLVPARTTVANVVTGLAVVVFLPEHVVAVVLVTVANAEAVSPVAVLLLSYAVAVVLVPARITVANVVTEFDLSGREK